MVLDFLAVDNFDFTRKIVDFFLIFLFGEKLVKLIFGQKYDFSNSVESQEKKVIFIRLSILYLSLIKDDKKLMCIIVFGDDKNTKKKTDEIVL